MLSKRTTPLLFLSCLACGAEDDGLGGPGSAGSAQAGATAAAGSASGGSGGGVAGSIGAAGSSAGQSGTTGGGPSGGAGNGGSGGSFVPGGGASGGPNVPPLDCGKDGWAVENHGDPKNRVNYVILGDGYTQQTVETTLKQHIEVMLGRRFE